MVGHRFHQNQNSFTSTHVYVWQLLSSPTALLWSYLNFQHHEDDRKYLEHGNLRAPDSSISYQITFLSSRKFEIVVWKYQPSWLSLNVLTAEITISDKTSYRKISWSLEVSRFVSRIVRSLWYLTSTSAALLPMCLSSFEAMLSLSCQSRGFETSRDLTTRRLIGYWNGALAIKSGGHSQRICDPTVYDVIMSATASQITGVTILY